jgi:hypothetical protein
VAHDIAWSIGGAEAARQVIRWTARLSLVLLTAALVVPSFGKAPRPFVRGLLGSHTLHGVGIAVLAVHTRGANVTAMTPFNVGAGFVAYLVVLGLVLWKGAPKWVVELGLLYVWGIFLVSYLDRALEAPRIYGPAIVLLLMGLLACASRRARTAPG